jgi:hypothetical protein
MRPNVTWPNPLKQPGHNQPDSDVKGPITHAQPLVARQLARRVRNFLHVGQEALLEWR